jgi:MFS family permease
MATKLETNVVYGAGLVQGIVLVTFPAASTIFTDPDEYDLSSSQYGAMFLPQVVTAIAASILGSGLARRHGSKRIYLAGLACGLVAMGLLVTSSAFTDEQGLAYGLLLVATAFLGAGFGLTVPTLNTFTAAFNPRAVDRSVLVLNALLGLGTVLAPVFVAIFVGLGFWWVFPSSRRSCSSACSQSACACRSERDRVLPRPRNRAGRRRSPAGSGCTPASRSSTGSARR